LSFAHFLWGEPVFTPPANVPTRNNPGMKKQSRFMRVVKILAPDDQFMFEAAQRIPEEELPNSPGAAGLELVVAVQKLREPLNAIEIQPPVDQENSTSYQPTSIKNQLSIKTMRFTSRSFGQR
jgi:hypothetical protein